MHVATPSTRPEMAQFITGTSSKLQYLTRLILHHWFNQGEKMIIWCNEPLTLFLVELLLEIYQFNFVSIHAGIQNANRVKAEWEFNHNPAVGFLVASSRSQTESMNLQNGGHIQVFLNVLGATPSIQACGRSHRIGQTKAVIVYRLTTDGTYDQVQQQVYQDRYRVAVAAQTKIDPTHAEKILQNLPANQRQDLERDAGGTAGVSSVADLATLDLAGPYADATIRELFGQRTNCYSSWNLPYQPDTKNMLPEEVIFRITQGGILADEVVDQLRARDKKNNDSAPGNGQAQEQNMDDSEILDPSFVPTPSAQPFGLAVVYTPDPPRAHVNTMEKYLIQAADELASRNQYYKNRMTAWSE